MAVPANPPHLFNSSQSHLVNEVDTEEVQNQRAKDVISKSTLMRDTSFLTLLICESSILSLGARLRGYCVGFTGLHAEGGCEDELTDSGTEATEESVERLCSMLVVVHLGPESDTYVVSGQDAVEELEAADEN